MNQKLFLKFFIFKLKFMIFTIWYSYSLVSPNLLRDCLVAILIERTIIKIIKLFIRLSEAVNDNDAELFNPRDKKIPFLQNYH